MNWSNARLIFFRELRDQLRDRRTLFMIAILPILLYPLLGMVVLQLKQFMQQHRAKVVAIGWEQVTDMEGLPPLFLGDHFAPTLVERSYVSENMDLHFAGELPTNGTIGSDMATIDLETARERLADGEYEAIVFFPGDFSDRLNAFRRELKRRNGTPEPGMPPEPASSDRELANDPLSPVQPEIFYNSANEKSQFAYVQVSRLLDQWSVEVGQQNLRDSDLPAHAARPFEFGKRDVAVGKRRNAAVWSKVLPFVVVIWALTGAFYPAIDLCAGEKERGTLETLLSSPARREEIVWGKLLTVMVFSLATAVLNLASLGLTGKFVIHQLAKLPGAAGLTIAAPPLNAALWLLVALIPVAALFSALCLALAALARSTKEGQYYLMPLVLVSMPLMILPMSPGVELTLGTSLVPLSGLVLLLRSLIEGNYSTALPYVVPVVGVTLVCCLLAIRWAVEQFNRESVLFRETEKLDLGRYLVHLVRDRQETPTVAAAFVCVALVFVFRFFVNFGLVSASMDSFAGVVNIILVSQVVVILLPGLVMALVLTRKPRKTLLLEAPKRWAAAPLAICLAALLVPIGHRINTWIGEIYQISDETMAQLQLLEQRLIHDAPSIWVVLLLMAVLPAICEELTFRGFILSGLRHLGHKWWAIVLSAVFFGFTHAVLQQSLAAIVIGVVIGYVAVQTGSLLPCMLFHATYNGLSLLSGLWAAKIVQGEADNAIARTLFHIAADGSEFGFRWSTVAVASAFGASILLWFERLPVDATREEALERARERQAQAAMLAETT